jgi:hypothetical protein
MLAHRYVPANPRGKLADWETFLTMDAVEGE